MLEWGRTSRADLRGAETAVVAAGSRALGERWGQGEGAGDDGEGRLGTEWGDGARPYCIVLYVEFGAICLTGRAGVIGARCQ